MSRREASCPDWTSRELLKPSPPTTFRFPPRGRVIVVLRHVCLQLETAGHQTGGSGWTTMSLDELCDPDLTWLTFHHGAPDDARHAGGTSGINGQAANHFLSRQRGFAGRLEELQPRLRCPILSSRMVSRIPGRRPKYPADHGDGGVRRPLFPAQPRHFGTAGRMGEVTPPGYLRRSTSLPAVRSDVLPSPTAGCSSGCSYCPLKGGSQ